MINQNHDTIDVTIELPLLKTTTIALNHVGAHFTKENSVDLLNAIRKVYGRDVHDHFIYIYETIGHDVEVNVLLNAIIAESESITYAWEHSKLLNFLRLLRNSLDKREFYKMGFSKKLYDVLVSYYVTRVGVDLSDSLDSIKVYAYGVWRVANDNGLGNDKRFMAYLGEEEVLEELTSKHEKCLDISFVLNFILQDDRYLDPRMWENYGGCTLSASQTSLINKYVTKYVAKHHCKPNQDESTNEKPDTTRPADFLGRDHFTVVALMRHYNYDTIDVGLMSAVYQDYGKNVVDLLNRKRIKDTGELLGDVGVKALISDLKGTEGLVDKWLFVPSWKKRL